MCIVYAHNNCVSALVETGAVGLRARPCIFYRMIGEAAAVAADGHAGQRDVGGLVVFVIAATALHSIVLDNLWVQAFYLDPAAPQGVSATSGYQIFIR